jgi:hypothetical protein
MFGFAEIHNIIENPAVFIEINDVESRNLRSTGNAPEWTQPKAILHVGKDFDKCEKWLFDGIDEIDFRT